MTENIQYNNERGYNSIKENDFLEELRAQEVVQRSVGDRKNLKLDLGNQTGTSEDLVTLGFSLSETFKLGDTTLGIFDSSIAIEGGDVYMYDIIVKEPSKTFSAWQKLGKKKDVTYGFASPVINSQDSTSSHANADMGPANDSYPMPTEITTVSLVNVLGVSYKEKWKPDFLDNDMNNVSMNFTRGFTAGVANETVNNKSTTEPFIGLSGGLSVQYIPETNCCKIYASGSIDIHTIGTKKGSVAIGIKFFEERDIKASNIKGVRNNPSETIWALDIKAMSSYYKFPDVIILDTFTPYDEIKYKVGIEARF